jgi:hypothetical protein
VRVTSCGLRVRVAGCGFELRVAGDKLRVAGYKLRVAGSSAGAHRARNLRPLFPHINRLFGQVGAQISIYHVH